MELHDYFRSLFPEDDGNELERAESDGIGIGNIGGIPVFYRGMRIFYVTVY